MTSRFIYVKQLSITLCRNYPKTIFVFGDNLKRRGCAGQAVIRYELNAYGIPTKRLPSMHSAAFFSDKDVVLLRRYYHRAHAYLLNKMCDGITIAWPEDGLGTGLAQLPKRAPTVFAMLTEVERQLRQAGEEIGRG